MADDKGKSYRNLLDAAASKGMEILEKNRKYTPTRETDQHILDRMLENVPGGRPRDLAPSGNPIHRKYGPASMDPKEPAPLDQAGFLYLQPKDATVDNSVKLSPAEKVAIFYSPYKEYGFGDYFSTKRSKLKGWEAYKRDLDTFHNKYETDRKAWDEAVARLKEAGKQTRRGNYLGLGVPDTLTASEEKQIQDLQNEVVASMTAPGAQKDRPGRIQEIVEGLDITEPDSAIRAFVREMKRRAIDDKLPRVMYGYKTEPGEDFMRRELEKRELIDTPRARAGILKSRGLQSLPKTLPVLDESGNRVPRYVDEMKAAREKAAEKAYQRSRKNPMQVGPDTPERD
jgi:hypothetical protein